MLIVIAWLAVIVLLTIVSLVVFSLWIGHRVEATVPPIGRFIDIDGSRVHYRDVGAGPTIVLVHGLAAQMQHLTYGLEKELEGRFRLVFIDRPGSGYSERVPGASARLPDQAKTVAGLIHALKLDRPLLVGHSLGGAVALATALDHPDVVGGLALIAPLTHPQYEPPEVLAPLAIESPLVRRIIAMTLATPLSMRNGGKTLIEIFGPNPVPMDFGTRGAALLGLRPKTFYAASSDIAAVNDDLPGMVARYPSLDVPVGLIYGADDRILIPKTQFEPMRHAVPGLVIETIEGQGHMLPITARKQTAAFIAAMAERLQARA